jgi:hypothetical protein
MVIQELPRSGLVLLPGSEIYGLYLKIEDLNLKSIKSGETFITFWGKDLRIFGKVLPL